MKTTTNGVRIACERCGTRLKSPRGWIGHVARCPRCHHTIAVDPVFAPTAADSSIDLTVDDRTGWRWLFGTLAATALVIVVASAWILRPEWLRATMSQATGYRLQAPEAGSLAPVLPVLADLRAVDERLVERLAAVEHAKARETFFVVDYKIHGGYVPSVVNTRAERGTREGYTPDPTVVPETLREVTIGPEGYPVNHGRFRHGHLWFQGNAAPTISGGYELGIRHGEWVYTGHFPRPVGDREVWRARYEHGKLVDAGGLAYEVIEDDIRIYCGRIKGELREGEQALYRH
jgi:hypothetical protein